MYHVSVGLAGQLAVRIVRQEAVGLLDATRGFEMSGYREAKRHCKKRLQLEAEERGTEKATRRRARWSVDFRDKIAILVAAAVLVPVVVFTLLSFYRSGEPDRPLPPPTMAGSAAGPRAAIVDQLSLTQPHSTFVETATGMLEQAGYAVDYFPGEEVTVEFYRGLPPWGHELIIFRVHSALGRVGDRPANWVTLFTSESYDKTLYRKEREKSRLT